MNSCISVISLNNILKEDVLRNIDKFMRFERLSYCSYSKASFGIVYGL